MTEKNLAPGAPRQPKPTLPQPPARFTLSDTGNAERLVSEHGRDLRYCERLGGWMEWDGRRWKPDNTGEVYTRAKQVVVEMARSGAAEGNKALVKHILEFANGEGVLAIAVGVETVAECEELIQLGCPLMQGYYFAKDGPPFDAVQMPKRN